MNETWWVLPSQCIGQWPFTKYMYRSLWTPEEGQAGSRGYLELHKWGQGGVGGERGGGFWACKWIPKYRTARLSQENCKLVALLEKGGA